MANVLVVTGKRSLRRPDEIRALLVKSARELFAARGYAGASTREIAQRAGVAETGLFRHFQTKARLFEAAIIEPFDEFFSRFTADWRAEVEAARANGEDAVRSFIGGLYDFLREHRELVMALMAVAYEEDLLIDGDSPLSRHIDELVETTVDELLGRKHPDVDLAARLPIALVMAVAVLDPWLFPIGRRHPSRERIVEELCQYALLPLRNQQ